MKILVTGAGGFIGSHLVDSQLKKGNYVRAVDLHLENLAHTLSHPRLEAVRGDITNTGFVNEIVRDIDVVYHLASAHLDVSLPDDYYRLVNVEAALSLVEAASEAGVKRFVHVSSVGVMGDVQDPPANEQSVCRPSNHYEKTKLEGEQVVLDFGRRTGFPIISVRPAWVYGPRCPRTEKIFKAISKGRFLIFGEGKNLRHPVYIDDAINGLELCAQPNQFCDQVYIIAGSEIVSVDELVRLISREWGLTPPKQHLPLVLGSLAGVCMETVFKQVKRNPPFSRRSLDFYTKQNAYDISKAHRDLGYEPKTDLRSGIQQTIRWLNGG